MGERVNRGSPNVDGEHLAVDEDGGERVSRGSPPERTSTSDTADDQNPATHDLLVPRVLQADRVQLDDIGVASAMQTRHGRGVVVGDRAWRGSPLSSCRGRIVEWSLSGRVRVVSNAKAKD